MQDRSTNPPEIDLSFSRRTALGGALAALLTPALMTLAVQKPAKADPGVGTPASPILRTDQSATMLADGSVLVAGGVYLGILSSAQLYSPLTNSWLDTGGMNRPRKGHAAALMADGRVLVCGGTNLGNLSDAEIYDPSTGLWSTAPSMNLARTGHEAFAVNGGVMVFGGQNLGLLASPELFDGTTWTLI